MYIIYVIEFNKNAYPFSKNHYYVGQHRTNNIYDKYMGTGSIVKKIYKKYGKDGAKKTILAITETLDVTNLLEKYFISFYQELYGKNCCFNIQKGGRNNIDFVMPEEAHRRNVESLKMFWKYNKNSDSVKIRNKRISEHMKGNKNGMGHTHNHNDETKKKISERVKATNATRIPKLRERSSKKIYVYKDGIYSEMDTVKYSWKTLGFSSEPACQRFVRKCTLFVETNDFSKFKNRFGNVFISYKPFDINIIKKLFK